MVDRMAKEGVRGKKAGRIVAETDRLNEERAGRRTHFDHPPAGTGGDQTVGFGQVLIRLYVLEDSASPVGGADLSTVFAEARAICERFLPPSYVQIQRKKYG